MHKPSSTYFPYTTLFRSCSQFSSQGYQRVLPRAESGRLACEMRKFFGFGKLCHAHCAWVIRGTSRSEEHTSELQSQSNLVCRLLLEKKKNHLVKIHLKRK